MKQSIRKLTLRKWRSLSSTDEEYAYENIAPFSMGAMNNVVPNNNLNIGK